MSVRPPSPSDETEDVQGNLPLLLGGKRLVGDKGKQEFGEGWHAAVLGAPVTAASFLKEAAMSESACPIREVSYLCITCSVKHTVRRLACYPAFIRALINFFITPSASCYGLRQTGGVNWPSPSTYDETEVRRAGTGTRRPCESILTA